MERGRLKRRYRQIERRGLHALVLAACGQAIVLTGAAALAQVPAPVAQPPAAAPAAPAMPAPLPPRALPGLPRVPARPDEPRAAKTYQVFETHCARCHQTGRTQLPLASGHLSNILALDELARDPVLVKPGLPDASRLYDVTATRHAPLEIYGEAADAPEPSPDDILQVRDWIKYLPPDVQACTSREPVKTAAIDGLMREAQRAEREQAGEVRFLSLMHLYNACATDAEMSAYRQALTKLINSLSSAADPVKLTPVDPGGSVLSFKLSDIGWTAERWEEVAARYPKTLARKHDEAIIEAAGTQVPSLNGDWFAEAASAPPLYASLVDLPPKLTDLARTNGVDIDRDIRRSAARRILVRSSGVTRANRLIERHPGNRGGFWMVYDFATGSGEQDLLQFPLGPKSATGARAAFKHDEVRVIFPLPNGFMAYALYDAIGNRIDRVLPGIELPYAGIEGGAPEPTTEAAGACIRCHAQGIIGGKDEFLPYVQAATATTPSDARAAALSLYGSDSENALLISGDLDRYQRALAAVGIDSKLRVRGQEPVTALARRYREDTDIEAALGETGLERDVFLAELASSGGRAAPLARRLLHGVLPRADLDRLFTLLQGIDVPGAQRSAAGGFLREPNAEIGLSLWVDKPRPNAGDLIVIQAEADATCYLTVISIDARGKATVLYPNDFEQDNRIARGESIEIPGGNAPYQLRFKGEGPETLVARCSASSLPPAGIEHDFVRQRFTVLGNWENFIQDTLVTEADFRRSPEKAARARLAQAGADRQRRARGERTERRPDIDESASLRDGRAILVLGGK